MAKPTKRTRKLKNNETLQVNTTGGAVRISQPGSDRGKQSARETAAVVVDLVTPKAVDGFVGFLRENAVVGLAVGIVVGSQLKVIVDTLNNSIINPLFGLLFGSGTLSTQSVTLNWGAKTAVLGWGAVIYQILDFIFILAVVYAIIKIFKLDKLDKPKPKK